MKYLPFENITLHTELSADEILRRLNEDILPFDSFSWRGYNPDNKAYQGYTINKEFYISKAVARQMPAPPIIIGELHKNETGTDINVKVRLDRSHGIFELGFLGISVIVVVFTIISGISSKTLNVGQLSVWLIASILLYIMIMSSFKRDSKHAKEYLTQLFEAEIKSTP